jgi:murein DD-endopeptidase MepM/ murein hydrolase activator NlpD
MAQDYSRREVLDIIERVAGERGISRDDFLRFAYIETGGNFNERAHNRGSDAKGLFQFVPGTAAQYGISGREYDPNVNTDAAARLYLNNRRDLVNAHERNGRPYLSGAAEPNGLDMYLAHQQGSGGYRSIQNAIATGEFSLSSTRRNILANVSSDDFERLTGHKYQDFRGMAPREMATAFTQYWDAKFDRVRIPEKGIEPITAGQQPAQTPATPAASALADGVLRKNERGPEVIGMQQSLNQLGFRDGRGQQLETRTGIYGDRTAESVRSFQQANNIEPTGVADRRTLDAINAQLQLPAESRNRPPAPQADGNWPAPGNITINRADKHGEGHGEFGTSRSGGTRTHKGVDIQGNLGDPIQAYAGGTVRVQPNNGGAGNTVTIDHGNGVVTRYFHLKDINVQDGQRIEAGAQVGTMGRTGNTPRQGDTHLHFEMWRNGRAVDPMNYLTVPGRERAAQPTTEAPATRSVAPSNAELGRDNPLYNQALAHLEKLGPNGGFRTRDEMERAAATTAFEAKVTGLSRIDALVASTTGQGLIAAQTNPNNPHDTQRVYVDKQQAVAQPVSERLQQFDAEVKAQEKSQPGQPQAPQPQGPSL